MKIAVVTPKSIKGEKGGAENLYEGLIKALREAGHEANQVEVLVDESTFEGILEAYCNCFYLDLGDYDLVISTKAPTYMVRHQNHVSYLLHTIRVFYDMFDREYEYAMKGTRAFYEGKIYLQSIASILPVLVLAPESGETILDVCAAPGSKTTQLAMMMKNQGNIFAIEQNQIRFDKLMHNCKLQ